MILASGARGPGFNSQSSPVSVHTFSLAPHVQRPDKVFTGSVASVVARVCVFFEDSRGLWLRAKWKRKDTDAHIDKHNCKWFNRAQNSVWPDTRQLSAKCFVCGCFKQRSERHKLNLVIQ